MLNVDEPKNTKISSAQEGPTEGSEQKKDLMQEGESEQEELRLGLRPNPVHVSERAKKSRRNCPYIEVLYRIMELNKMSTEDLYLLIAHYYKHIENDPDVGPNEISNYALKQALVKRVGVPAASFMKILGLLGYRVAIIPVGAKATITMPDQQDVKIEPCIEDDTCALVAYAPENTTTFTGGGAMRLGLKQILRDSESFPLPKQIYIRQRSTRSKKNNKQAAGETEATEPT